MLGYPRFGRLKQCRIRQGFETPPPGSPAPTVRDCFLVDANRFGHYDPWGLASAKMVGEIRTQPSYRSLGQPPTLPLQIQVLHPRDFNATGLIQVPFFLEGLFCVDVPIDPYICSVVSPFWLIAWATALSWCWLLPNHYVPWSAFHMDAWAAAMYLLIAAAVLWRTREQLRASASGIVVLGLLVTPWLQFAAGTITSAGTAWMPFSYLLGFALSIFVGQRWEQRSLGQVGDGLFMAIGIAAMVSVGLQLHQWLQLDLMDIWSMGNGFGRPYANFGQPNQLGTLLLWGVLALVWGAWRAHIRPMVAIAAVVFLLFGLALTASRTAWISVILLAAAAWYWRPFWPWRISPWVATGLAACFFCFVWIVPLATQGMLLGSMEGEIEALTRMSSEMRPRIWTILIEALWQRPWLGFGWNQVATAQLAAAANHPPLGVLFSHAHNVFLDFLIWNGIPLGLTLSGLVLLWLWRRLRAVNDAGSALLFLLVVVVGNHAMLELPLQYAYFLLPVGMVVGSLDVRLHGRMMVFGLRRLMLLLWFACAALLALMVRDYARVETSYQVLRFEWANIRINASRDPPDVLLLGQLRDVIALARFEPSPSMSEEELNWMRNVASLNPNAGVIHKLAVALVWKHQPAEASLWLRRMCAVVPSGNCKAVKSAWENQSKTDLLIANVPWPN